MTSIDKDVHFAPIPSQSTDPNVVVLTFDQTHSPSRHTRLHLCLFLSFAVVIILVAAAAVFSLYPSDPEIQLVRIKLDHIQVHSSNKLLLNLSFSLTIKVRNKDFLSIQYNSLVVSIGYRGRDLGFVSSDGGRVKARGTSYVNATQHVRYMWTSATRKFHVKIAPQSDRKTKRFEAEEARYTVLNSGLHETLTFWNM